MRTRYALALGIAGWLVVGAGVSLLIGAWAVELVFAGVLFVAAGPGLLPAWRLAWEGYRTWQERARALDRAAEPPPPGWVWPEPPS